jgi:hypothetical protein
MKIKIENKKQLLSLIYERGATITAINEIAVSKVDFSNKHIVGYSHDYRPAVLYNWERKGKIYYFSYPVEVEYIYR